MTDPRIVVVGAGPAGTRAAATLVAAGIRPVVIDEGRRSGGQIYRRQPSNFRRSPAVLYGAGAGKAVDLHAAFDALAGRIDDRAEALAWSIFDNHIQVAAGGRSEAIGFDALILATGATDRLMAVPGWERPGVFSLGAAQIALKAQACAIGRRVVFLGTGPLLYLVAAQDLKAGAGVAAVLDTSAFSNRLRGLPLMASRPRLVLQGISFLAQLRRADVPVLTGVRPSSIGGDVEAGVTGIDIVLPGGAMRRLACDAVALGHHLRPETQLADLAGCAFRFDAQTRQWLPVIDTDGRSSQRGVYLAGDGTRLLGADGAERAGELSALSVLADLGRSVDGTRVARLRREQATMERFRQGLVRAFPWPSHFAKNLPSSARFSSGA